MKNDNTLETHMKTKKHNNETDNRNLKHKNIYTYIYIENKNEK